jgi:hypothetical protein
VHGEGDQVVEPPDTGRALLLEQPITQALRTSCSPVGPVGLGPA